jgi:predicted Zn-ribbon and HTH transcriptional regulator
MKHTRRCPKCSGQRIVRLAHVLDAADWGGAGGTHDPGRREGLQPVRRQLAVIVREAKSFGLARRVDAELTAQTEAYVCTECGFFEEYVKAPSEIPWSGVEGAVPLDPIGGETR